VNEWGGGSGEVAGQEVPEHGEVVSDGMDEAGFTEDCCRVVRGEEMTAREVGDGHALCAERILLGHGLALEGAGQVSDWICSGTEDGPGWSGGMVVQNGGDVKQGVGETGAVVRRLGLTSG